MIKLYDPGQMYMNGLISPHNTLQNVLWLGDTMHIQDAEIMWHLKNMLGFFQSYSVINMEYRFTVQRLHDYILHFQHHSTSQQRKLEWALGRAHTFAYHKIEHWTMNILALVACQLDKNWPRYGKKKILTFSWSWHWPLTRSIPKSNQMVPG